MGVRSGYRPISVLPVTSKLIERHIRDIVENFLNTNSISSWQWGFMSKGSTVLLSVIDDWLLALDLGFEISVFFDISKVFDMHHLYLLKKLYELSLDKYLIRWIRSNQSQFVFINGVKGEQDWKLTLITWQLYGVLLYGWHALQQWCIQDLAKGSGLTYCVQKISRDHAYFFY